MISYNGLYIFNITAFFDGTKRRSLFYGEQGKDQKHKEQKA